MMMATAAKTSHYQKDVAFFKTWSGVLIPAH